MDVAFVASVLKGWTKDGFKDGILKREGETYILPAYNKLALKNELLRYRATLPPMPYGLLDIEPDAIRGYFTWDEMVQSFYAGHIPEKDYPVYLEGIAVLGHSAMQKLLLTQERLGATMKIVQELMEKIDQTMTGLVATPKEKTVPNSAPDPTSEEK
ncbi:MAG: hypothetical protein HYW88_01790 [Candidatus Sungbacteria bacterium]|nr:hypothetical protein [Candidatus Sungbacteria bacterium]